VKDAFVLEGTANLTGLMPGVGHRGRLDVVSFQRAQTTGALLGTKAKVADTGWDKFVAEARDLSKINPVSRSVRQVTATSMRAFAGAKSVGGGGV